MTAKPIRTIAVVGDGVAGWTVAVALARRIPDVAVALVRVDDPVPGHVDLFGAMTPGAADWLRTLGVSPEDLVARGIAVPRLATRFSGFSSNPAFTLGYGPAGLPIEGVPFALLWPMIDTHDAFDLYAPGARLADAGKVPCGTKMFAATGVGLTVDPTRHAEMLAAHGRQMGVRVPVASFAGTVTEGGRTTSLRLGDGTRLTADLYVDATNGARRLRTAADRNDEDWTDMLTPHGATVTRTEKHARPVATGDVALAAETGWTLTTAFPEYEYGAQIVEDPYDIAFAAGRILRPWHGNVVAIGDAHAVIDPVGAIPFELLHAQVDRLIASIPDTRYADCETRLYDRQANREADALRDIAVVHHLHRRPPRALPRSLVPLLDLFRVRGRIPPRDGDRFDRDYWTALLFGLGECPRPGDALAAGVDHARARRLMTEWRIALDAEIAAAPHPGDTA